MCSWHWDCLLAGRDELSHRFNLHQGPFISKYSNSLESEHEASQNPNFFFLPRKCYKVRISQVVHLDLKSKQYITLPWKYCKMKNPVVPIVIVSVTELQMGSFVSLPISSNTKEQMSVAERTGVFWCCFLLGLLPKAPVTCRNFWQVPALVSPLPVLLPASIMPGTTVSFPKEWCFIGEHHISLILNQQFHLSVET